MRVPVGGSVPRGAMPPLWIRRAILGPTKSHPTGTSTRGGRPRRPPLRYSPFLVQNRALYVETSIERDRIRSVHSVMPIFSRV